MSEITISADVEMSDRASQLVDLLRPRAREILAEIAGGASFEDFRIATHLLVVALLEEAKTFPPKQPRKRTRKADPE